MAHYGKLTVGDQILVADGISLIDVTHEEAVAALQRAMDMESVSNLWCKYECCQLTKIHWLISNPMYSNGSLIVGNLHEQP